MALMPSININNSTKTPSTKNNNRLKILYLEKKYALAYAICLKFPSLKLTIEYKKMEDEWIQNLKKAQKYILIDRLDLAKDSFKNYITVISKRPTIELMLKHNKLFVDFLIAQEKREFNTIDKIARENKLFKQLPIFESFDNEIKQTIEQIKENLYINELSQAHKLLSKIDTIPSFAKDTKLLHVALKNIENLHKMYDDGDFCRCYELLDSEEELRNTQLGKLLEKHWNKLISRSKASVLDGDICSIETIFCDFKELTCRKQEIDALIKSAIIINLKYLLAHKKFSEIQTLIYRYIDNYSKDEEIDILMLEFEISSGERLAITI